jgi:hypothetical protein
VLAAIPDDLLDAMGRQALRDCTTAYPLTAGDVLRTWQAMQPAPTGPRRPFLPSGPPPPPVPDPPPVALTRLLGAAVVSRGWGPPPAAFVATLLTDAGDASPVDLAVALAPYLRAATGWADVAAWWAVCRPVPAPPAVGR